MTLARATRQAQGLFALTLAAAAGLAVSARADDDAKQATPPSAKPAAKPADQAELPAIPDKNPAVLLQFYSQQLRKVAPAQRVDFAVAVADKILAHKDANEAQRRAGYSLKLSQLRVGALDNADKYGDSLKAACDQAMAEKNPELAELGAGNLYLFQFPIARGAVPTAKSIDALVALAKKYPTGQMPIGIAGMLARGIRDEDQAVAFLKSVRAAMSENPRAGDIDGMIFSRKPVGKTMDLSGPTLDGKEFSISSLKGKVVLVDFWATWCGPCIQELPNVKAAYEKHHDAGFEIVGVSLDQSRDRLESFVKENNMPWVQIVHSEPAKMFWNAPAAKQFGVNSIPATYLLGRDGKIIAFNLRGKNLEAAVAKALGGDAKAGAKPAKGD